MARLDQRSLEFAKTHIKFFYDSDFFPKAFEFQVLFARWDEVLEFATGRDVVELPAPRPRIMAAPKPGYGYRIVHLDPLSTLIYTALTFRVAARLEAVRAPVEAQVACAYRVAIDETNGRFFGSETGYEGFLGQCRRLASEHPFVLVTDISDFYNQVYLHRLQNVIAFAAPELGDDANAIEDYLIVLNARVSKGIPVGPAASIIMAEAVLNDLDQLISASSLRHSRYVDDIRIFGPSRQILDFLFQELTKYLYDTHRLTLSSHKTEIIPSGRFIEKYLQSPKAIESREAHSQLRRVSERTAAYGSYILETHSADHPDPSIIQAVMNQLCSRDQLDLGLARHILRKCRQYRIRAIIPELLQNFASFAPVMPAVVLYLEKVSSESFLDRYVESVSQLYDLPTTDTPFVRMWLDGYVAGYRQYLNHSKIREKVRNSPSMAARAKAATTLQDVAWVRRQKTEIENLGSVDRRQVLRASLVLSSAERVPWLRSVLRNQEGLVDRIVIHWLLSQ